MLRREGRRDEALFRWNVVSAARLNADRLERAIGRKRADEAAQPADVRLLLRSIRLRRRPAARRPAGAREQAAVGRGPRARYPLEDRVRAEVDRPQGCVLRQPSLRAMSRENMRETQVVKPMSTFFVVQRHTAMCVWCLSLPVVVSVQAAIQQAHRDLTDPPREQAVPGHAERPQAAVRGRDHTRDGVARGWAEVVVADVKNFLWRRATSERTGGREQTEDLG